MSILCVATWQCNAGNYFLREAFLLHLNAVDAEWQRQLEKAFPVRSLRAGLIGLQFRKRNLGLRSLKHATDPTNSTLIVPVDV